MINKTTMQLKPWLSLAEAAEFLSTEFNEKIVMTDILRFAMEGKLQLSIRFINFVPAKVGEVVKLCDADSMLTKDKKLHPRQHIRIKPFKENAKLQEKGDTLSIIAKRTDCFDTRVLIVEDGKEALKHSDNTRFLNLKDKITNCTGVYELAMIGTEVLWVENEYQLMTNGPELEYWQADIMDGAFVSLDDDTIYQLQDEFKNHPELNVSNGYFPLVPKPHDSELIIKTAEAQSFVELYTSHTLKKPRSIAAQERERNSMLKIIYGIAISKYDYDPNKDRNSATGENSGSIRADLELKGILIDNETVKKYLDEAGEKFGE